MWISVMAPILPDGGIIGRMAGEAGSAAVTSIARSAVHQAAAVAADPPAAPGFSPTYGTASERMPAMTMISTRAQQVAAMAGARARDGFALVALDGMGAPASRPLPRRSSRCAEP